MARVLAWAAVLGIAAAAFAQAQTTNSLTNYFTNAPPALTVVSPDVVGVVQSDVLHRITGQYIVASGGNIQTALTSAAANGGGDVHVKAGTYAITSALLMSSNTRLVCEGGALITASSVGWSHVNYPNLGVNNNAAVTNVHNNAVSLTDHDISIEGCQFQALGTFATDGNFFHVYLRRVSRATVKSNSFIGGGDATAFLKSDDTLVADNYANVGQCWDHFEAPVRAKVRGGYCIALGVGALFTGTDATGTLNAQADDFELIGGSYVMAAGAAGVGIWANGLGPAGSGASHGRIVSPFVDMSARTGFSVCTRYSGGGTDTSIDVICKGGEGYVVEVSNAGDSGGFPTHYTISAISRDLNSSTAAIRMAGSDGLLSHASLVGGAYTYVVEGSGAALKVDPLSINAPVGSLGLYNLTGYAPTYSFGGNGVGYTNIGQLDGSSAFSAVSFTQNNPADLSTANYSLLGEGANTVINAPSASGIIDMRINNSAVGKVCADGGIDWAAAVGGCKGSGTLNLGNALWDNGVGPTGSGGSGYVRAGSPTLVTPIITGYAVLSLPSGTIGMLAYVTDQAAACPAKGVAPTNGGALKCVVFYNGSAWVGI